MEKKKRIREKIGQVFQVPLGDNKFGYGQVVTDTEHAFFDYYDQGNPQDIEVIIKKSVIFKVVVDSYVIRESLWPVVGILSVSPTLQKSRIKFIYDTIAKKYMLCKSVLEQIPATLEEIYNLECFASWGSEHVEQRLRDHFAERPNYDVENFRNQHNPNFERDIEKFYAQYGYEFKLPSSED